MAKENILIWLPSPLGDAVLCTPALRALREKFKSQRIHFLADSTVRGVLSPCKFSDKWLETDPENTFTLARKLQYFDFKLAIIFKNSFGSALTLFLAKIPQRVGYAREGRTILLTGKIPPNRKPDGTFKPVPMIDYYLTIAKWFACETDDRTLELSVDEEERSYLSEKVPTAFSTDPLIILVPGGAFGPSKLWPAQRFAQLAKILIEKYNANIIVSVAPNETEARIAKHIRATVGRKIHNLAETPLTIGQFKALFDTADLVITNDTGPRHIATALGKKVITLFGPNDPRWTRTDYENEIQITGSAPCVPCDKPECSMTRHSCMNSITVDMVCDAADKMLSE